MAVKRNRIEIKNMFNVKDTTYIHYGSDSFHPEWLNPQKKELDFFDYSELSMMTNNLWFNKVLNKPAWGLWASPEDSEYGWKEWCEDANFMTDLSTNFKFKLKSDARVLEITKKEDLESLPIDHCEMIEETYDNVLIDWQKITEEYDAVYVKPFAPGIDRTFQSWDAESLVVFYPDSIEVV